MDLKAAFLRDCRDRGMSPETIHTYAWNIDDYRKFLGKKDPAKIERQDLKAYLDYLRSRGVSKKTASLYFAVLKTFYDWLVYEGHIKANPIEPIRKRYLQSYKLDSQSHTHQIITVDEAAKLIDSLVDIRDKAMVTLLFKTGVRRRELIAMDLKDINWKDQSIILKPTAKRSNRIVFFDDEAAALLRRWLAARENRVPPGETALFVGLQGRLRAGGVQKTIVQAAIRIGLHDRNASDMEHHFSPHCCRHFFTTHLLRAGMLRDHVKWLRGDVMKEAIDIYYHIDPEDVRRSYLAHVPQLGI